MKQLDEILRLRREIDELRERISELKAMTQPKAQVISDMPRGGGERKNTIEEYVIKSEKLREKLACKLVEFDEKWDGISRTFIKANLTVAQCTMMEARFRKAMPWRLCVKHMCNVYPSSKWNEQKLFRMYRNVLYKISKI